MSRRSKPKTGVSPDEYPYGIIMLPDGTLDPDHLLPNIRRHFQITRTRRRRTAKGYLTAAQVAERCGVDIETVYTWINAGELRAVNRSRSKAAKQPRWMIAEDDLAVFLATRATQQPVRRLGRRRSNDGVIEFYR